MRESLKLGTCREVHSKLVILGKNELQPSEEGWTSVVLIDESHITSHAYSDRGKLAIDLFTCGQKSNPEVLATFIIEEITKVYPDIVIDNMQTLNRFPY
jgi:S-adenosylmethionine/arginine decarboxylase-like enzyme